jgi:CRISPR/Cas system CSM-associated protein Csm3 (group 7 of RAMP superfamily)
MTKSIYRLTGTLRALAPLHVGTGGTRYVDRVQGKAGKGSNKAPEVTEIVRDAVGRPYIPGPTLKGLLRRLCENVFRVDSTEVISLMGEIKQDKRDECGGRIGAVLVRGAALIGTPPDVQHMPYADKRGGAYEANKTLGPGVFVAARTRINAAVGTADDNKLFHMEMVAEGTEFLFDVVMETRGSDHAEQARTLRDNLVVALEQLADPQGAAIGKGQADGLGAIRLMPESLKIERRSLTKTGDLEIVVEPSPWKGQGTPKSAHSENTIRLRCNGPFIVIDSSYEPPARSEDGNNKDRVQIRAQRKGERSPLLLSTSISGALRNRARWLAGLIALRSADKDFVVDDPDAIAASAAAAAKLTTVQHLFGVTGFRGLLSIKGLTVSDASPWNVTSVKIDRFSGAPVDNALFTTQGFLETAISFELVFDEARYAALPVDHAAAATKKLYELLRDDIRKNGLELGHGVNKGFGWFEPVGGAA